MLLLGWSVAGLATSSPRAYLTREQGKNRELKTLLEARGVATEELPCISFERTEGFDRLCAMLSDVREHPWVAITSPAAAEIFAEAWAQAETGATKPSIASVGAGSAKVLEAAGLPVDFLPSKADGKTLAAELPVEGLAEGEAGSVLFPASALAENTIAEGLADRGIRTTRIDTYTTVPADWAAADLTRAKAARLVTFGSPSAVRVWAERVGTAAAAVCIGETTAAEARKCGFEDVVAPTSPGRQRNALTEAWAACCADALEGMR